MIVIPMAGMSSRFLVAGYDQPKFMLPLNGMTVFDHALNSFKQYFPSLPFLFIARGDQSIENFVRQSCAAIGLRKFAVHMLQGPTAGQAETVEMGLRSLQCQLDIPITIFNIDTFRPGFRFPDDAWTQASDGYLEVFRGSGSNWSYVRADAADSNRVIETAEKREISNLCCTGLYHFNRAGDFLLALDDERIGPSSKELYVAPLYNHLIRRGRNIHFTTVPSAEIIFCGVPAEYETLVAAAANTQTMGRPNEQ